MEKHREGVCANWNVVLLNETVWATSHNSHRQKANKPKRGGRVKVQRLKKKKDAENVKCNQTPTGKILLLIQNNHEFAPQWTAQIFVLGWLSAAILCNCFHSFHSYMTFYPPTPCTPPTPQSHPITNPCTDFPACVHTSDERCTPVCLWVGGGQAVMQ